MRAGIRIAAFALSAAIVVVGAELSAAGLFLFQQGRSPYVGAPAADAPPTAGPALTNATDGDRMRLFPYWGYGARPGMKPADIAPTAEIAALVAQKSGTWHVNSFGFWSAVEYPYTPQPNDFVVGFFGGSVAQEIATTLEGGVTQRLARIPALAGKKIVVLNFTQAGLKQPQQLMTLAYALHIGQRFNYILNIDGFLELFIGWLNINVHHIDSTMPFGRFMNGIANQFADRLTGGQSTRAGALIRSIAERKRRLASGNAALLQYYQLVRLRQEERQLYEIERTAAESNPDLDYPGALLPPRAKDFDAGVPLIAGDWARGSIAMAALAQGFGVPYLHVLQPNQYYTKYKFTPQQAAKFLNETNPPLREIVPKGYHALLAEAGRISARGIDFLDATSIFDAASEGVFLDNCCHYSRRGNEILIDAIVERVAQGLSSIPEGTAGSGAKILRFNGPDRAQDRL